MANMECSNPQLTLIQRTTNIKSNSLLHLQHDLQQFSELLEKESRDQDFQEVVKSQKTIDAEFEELTGFLELGFEFREEQLSPRVMDLIPGLKYLIMAKKINVKAREEQQRDSVIMFPPPSLMKGEDMKQLLKLWARSVASSLR